MSVKPCFAERILLGEKKYEFRRTIFSRKVDVVLLYVTTPVQRVVAEFDILGIISEPLDILWKRTRKHAGIEKALFYDYFNGLEKGHAIEIGDIRLYNEPFCPTKRLGIKPPQSFAYIGSSAF